jgi:hypothetical protein
VKELKRSTQLDGTAKENKRAGKRMLKVLSEKEKKESMSDKYDYLDK